MDDLSEAEFKALPPEKRAAYLQRLGLKEDTCDKCGVMVFLPGKAPPGATGSVCMKCVALQVSASVSSSPPVHATKRREGAMTMPQEVLAFLVHAVKQFCFGFDALNATSDDYEDGSAAKAFYMNSTYHYISIFYLLDRKDRKTKKLLPMGGTFYKALKPYGHEDVLEPIRETLETPIGTTTFGEVVRVFRNEAVVHTNYRNEDLDRLYKHADFQDPNVMQTVRELIVRVYLQTRELPRILIKREGLDPADFGVIVS